MQYFIFSRSCRFGKMKYETLVTRGHSGRIDLGITRQKPSLKEQFPRGGAKRGGAKRNSGKPLNCNML